MGTYCTSSSLAIRMPGVQFTTTGNVNTIAAEAIADAEAEVNKYLSKRYDLSASTFQTTTSIPPMVRSISTWLAEGYMWHMLSRGGAGKESVARGDSLIKRATENLKLIADYQLDLVNTTGSVLDDMSNTAYRVLSSTRNYEPTFKEDGELDQAVDTDKLDDISSERD